MLDLLAQTTQPTSVPDIAAYQAFALQLIEALVVVGTAAIAGYALLKSKANEAGLTAHTIQLSNQHDRLENQQAAINSVQMAMPAPQQVVVQQVHPATFSQQPIQPPVAPATTLAGTWPRPSATIPKAKP